MTIKKKSPLISIGIPTYNRPEELDKCVRNLLNQTYKNIEIIICDNNSTNNNNKNLYNSKIFKNEKIKLFHNKKNIGILRNTVKVLNFSSGDFFCWVSDDDWRSSTFIEEMYKDIYEKGEGYISFCSYCETINENRISQKHKEFKPNLKLLQSNNKFIRKFYYYFLDHANGKCNLFYSLIPTKELRRVNFRNASSNWTDLSMDRNIVLSLLERNKVTINPKKLASLKVDNKKFYLKKDKSNKRNKIFNLSFLISFIKDLNLEKKYFINENKKKFHIIFIVYFTFLLKFITVLINRFSLKFFYLKKKLLFTKRSRIEEAAIKKIEKYEIQQSRKYLSDTTLVAVATTEVERAAMALRYSMLNIKFKKVLLIGNYNPWNLGNEIHFKLIKSFKDVGEWGKFIVFDLHEYIETKYVILVHPDGFIVNPDLWDEQFKKYDYIGAPWPKPNDNFSYRTPTGEIIEVGNSVSLRSKKLLELPKKIGLEWKSYYGNYHEDGFICVHNRNKLKSYGIKFPSKEIAYKFGIETFFEEYKSQNAFTFHKWKKANKNYPNFEQY